MGGKRIWLWPLILLVAAGARPGWANALRDHPSPYLAMHGEDPVAWRTWDQDALNRARREQKLLFISSGYFACHWCHVMQAESYQNPGIAAFLNRHFIPVKVDRELRPALDAYLIEFVRRTRGHAGWPLNVFLSPSGHPVAGTTYLPADRFMGYLQRLQALWTDDSAGLEKLARRAAVALNAASPQGGRLDAGRVAEHGRRFVARSLSIANDMSGGFGQQAKFPSTPQLRVLLQRQAAQPNPEVAEFLQLTLEQMAGQGLRDHLGGGFFRYTVDPGWQVPHFEKMLYDNVQLAQLYLQAAAVLGEPAYEGVARDTLDFLLQDMWYAPGAFISSLSAVDEQGVEGGYYLWDDATLVSLLSEEELKVVRLTWDTQAPAPFEAGYLPRQAATPAEIAKTLSLPEPRMRKHLATLHRKLRQERRRRNLPRDTKLLAAWNGLALTVLADAARLPGGEEYRRHGEQLREYLGRALWDGNALRRATDGRQAVGSASLEDYAYVAWGLLAWARLSGDARDYQLTKRMLHAAWQRFHTPRGWRRAAEPLLPLIPRGAILADGPLPSPSAIILDISLALAKQIGDEELSENALAVLARDYPQLASSPFAHATHIGVLLRYADLLTAESVSRAASP